MTVQTQGSWSAAGNLHLHTLNCRPAQQHAHASTANTQACCVLQIKVMAVNGFTHGNTQGATMKETSWTAAAHITVPHATHKPSRSALSGDRAT